uniref:DEUBAD domain-containing protein n=1 Tax=Felis catus TaxID=9685 RepID=A0ABI7YBR8_FELCA
MDSLDHMLTDPLELGPCGDGHGTRIMEDCLLGGTRVSLPEDLLEDPEIFFDVVSLSTWQEVLSESQREHLQQFLPHFPEDSLEQQNQLVLALFSGENFRFGNPLHIAQKLFRDGHFNPEVVKYRQLCFKSQYKRYLTSQQQYFHRLLKQILASRNDLLEMARRSGPALPFRQKRPSPSRTPEEREWRTQQRYLKVLREVKEECGDTDLSSDEEDLSSWLPSSPARSPSPAVPLRVVPTLSTTDMKTADKIELGDSDLKIMLKKHHEKRKHQPDHPDLLTGDLTLNDIMTRVNAGRKGSLAALYDLAVLKKKVKEKEEKKKKKIKLIKSEAEDLAEPLSSADGIPPLSQAPSPLAIPAIKEEPLEDLKPCLGINEISSSFFSLLLEILLLEGQASLPMLEERVLDWQSSPASSLNSWFSAAPNWAELVLPALQYLAGESRAVPSSFSPFVEFKEKTQQWKLLGQSQDNEKELAALFQLWLETKDQAFCKQENEDSSDATTPVPRVRTDYVVRPSTGEEKRVFQEQERYRYSQPHKAFTFRMHGFESVVGPVKGVFDKETSLNKAREHSLLRSDRPAYVTILSLVRDAAARLPNGEGTRAEICELLKDSQFLAPDVTSTQVNTVVSGALDRLHYEKDPCVKYDIGRKLWIYLHRDRSEEEFERIHQAQAAAAKARKALQQKPKPPSKVKSGSKESSLKVLSSGPSEQSQMSLSDSSMPPTPVTPVTPTTPALPATPISPPPVSSVNKSGPTPVSEPAKSSSGVLLVSSPTMPQLGTMLSPASSQTPPNSQAAARVVSHSGSAGLPQVRVVAQPGLPTATQQSAGPTQTLPQMPAGPQMRVPATATQTKVVPQTVMATVPVKAQTAAATVQRPGPGTGLTMTSLPATASPASKPATSSPGSSAPSASTAAVIQNVTGQNIIKQVAITGQLGVKPQAGSSIPLTATNFRIQGKDVLRLPPSSITTDAKGQTVLRITPDMMATLAKSQVTTVKLTQDLFGTGSGTAGKGISATLHVTSNPVHATDSPAKASSASAPSSTPTGTTVVKVTPDLKPTEASSSAFRLMPALGVSVADQKGKNTVASSEAKPAATIRIVQGLGVMPPKAGQTITVATHAKQGSSVASGSGTVHTSAVSLPSMNAAVSKTVAVASGAASTPISIGAGASAVRQVPVSTTVVSTSQAGKLPTRITVPLSVISQPMKGKSVVTAPIIKGNLGANLGGLGRNIILTTMPAGTKLIAGNKPVSFLTAQQLQQLQQQGQATQVRTAPGQSSPSPCPAGARSPRRIPSRSERPLPCPSPLPIGGPLPWPGVRGVRAPGPWRRLTCAERLRPAPTAAATQQVRAPGPAWPSSATACPPHRRLTASPRRCRTCGASRL